MPAVDVFDLHKRKVGVIELSQASFETESDVSLIHAAVVMQRAGERQGTASTLRRGEVSGSGKKPWKQKHTGRARAGSIRSPLWRHGGSVFGPRSRSYAFSMPKKKYRAALQSALAARLADGAVLVVSDFAIERPKTRLLAKTLAQLGVGKGTLLVIGEDRSDLERAARNLAGVKMVRPEALNVYDVLKYRTILIPEGELRRVQQVWS
jgi:large subunit ribosomal protein L4